MDFIDIGYLKHGNPRQRSACETLTHYRVLQQLCGYNALLVGTVPIEIDIETSDLDIICNCPNLIYFKADVMAKFGGHKNFSIREADVNKQPVVVANFWLDNWEIEIYGQAVPTIKQNAYRHMLAEYHLLQQHGDELRQKVIDLKKQGYKTEPAFAMALNLPGDPYIELLRLSF